MTVKIMINASIGEDLTKLALPSASLAILGCRAREKRRRILHLSWRRAGCHVCGLVTATVSTVSCVVVSGAIVARCGGAACSRRCLSGVDEKR